MLQTFNWRKCTFMGKIGKQEQVQMKLNDTDENFVFILVLRHLFLSFTTEKLAQFQIANYPLSITLSFI